MAKFVDHLTEILAKKIEKPTNMTKGLFLLQIKKSIPGKKPEELNIVEWKKTLYDMKKRLELIKAPNPEKIVNEMVSHITENQSLITMIGI